MFFPEISEDFISSVKCCKRVIICGHMKPDGDCVSSAIAAYALISNLGKEAIIVNDGPFSNTQISGYENRLSKSVPPEFRGEGTLGLVVDCSTPDRLGTMVEYFRDIDVSVIDHHSTGTPFGNHRYVVPDSPSTTLLVYKLFKSMGIVPDKETAAAIFRGFVTDSGFFRFIRSQSGPVFQIISELADLGIDPNLEYHDLFEQGDFNSLRYVSVLVSRTQRMFAKRLCISWEDQKDAESFGCSESVSDKLYEQLLSVKETEAVFFFKYSQTEKDRIVVGMRASGNSEIDVGTFAGKFGGGGHKKAAGATIIGTMDQVRKMILKAAGEDLFFSDKNNGLKSFVDTHFHYTKLEPACSESDELMSKLISGGLAGGIEIGTEFDDLPKRAEILKKYPQIKLSAAMGPWACGKSETSDKVEEGYEIQEIKTQKQIDDEFAILVRNIEKYNPSFIGECGLDYYWEYGTHEKQIRLFKLHMDIAYKLNKRVIIHSREADRDTEDIILRYKNRVRGIIHCFSGDENLLKTALDCGYYISFAGNITFKKNEELRKTLASVPSDRLLLETDAPFLAPEPYRGQKNSPSLIPHTYLCASHVRGMSVQDLANLVMKNFCTLTGQSNLS